MAVPQRLAGVVGEDVKEAAGLAGGERTHLRSAAPW